jgi:hypothetical protein
VPCFSAINSLQECSSLFEEPKGGAAFAGYAVHQGGGKPVHIKMTLFGLYLIRYQPHLSIFESF